MYMELRINDLPPFSPAVLLVATKVTQGATYNSAVM